MVCNQCGTANQDGVKFCMGCGAMLNGAPEQPAAPVRRPVRPVKKQAPMGPVKLLVIVLTVLALIFGVVHLFVDYVIESKTTNIVNNDGDKSIDKGEEYYFKSQIYQMIEDEELKEAKEAIEEADGKLTGSYVWLQIGNILGGIGCILVAVVGVLYVVGFYDQIFGNLLKGRSALCAMGLGGAAFSVLHLICYVFGGIKMVAEHEDVITKATATFGAHWTVWAFLIISLLAVIYDLKVLTRKKR